MLIIAGETSKGDPEVADAFVKVSKPGFFFYRDKMGYARSVSGMGGGL